MSGSRYSTFGGGAVREHARVEITRLTAERDRAIQVAETLARILSRITVIDSYDADLAMDGLIAYDRLAASLAQGRSDRPGQYGPSGPVPLRVADFDR